MRRLIAVALVCAALVGLVGSWALAKSNRGLATSVVCTATAVTNVIGANPNRRFLTLQNVGTLHINVGGQVATGLTTPANFYGMTIHVGSTMQLTDFQGGLNCMTQTGTGSSTLEVLEETE